MVKLSILSVKVDVTSSVAGHIDVGAVKWQKIGEGGDIADLATLVVSSHCAL